MLTWMSEARAITTLEKGNDPEERISGSMEKITRAIGEGTMLLSWIIAQVSKIFSSKRIAGMEETL